MSTLKVGAVRGVSASSDAISVADDGTCTANVTNNLSNRRININGGMQFWQRATSVSISEGNNEGVTACDRHGFEFGNASAGAATISRSTDTPTNLGFPYSFKIDVTTINNLSAANTQIRMHHKIESQDIRNSGWKYNDPNSFLTISFYFKSNKSGTNKLPINVISADGTTYYYVSEITQSDTNWNRHTVKIPGNANLTFDNDSGAGLQVYWYFAVGSTYHTTADTWGTTQKHGTSNSTNYFDSTSNDMFITGIQMEATTNGIATDFEHRSFADEIQRCYRYYWQSNGSLSGTVPADMIHGDFINKSTTVADCSYRYAVRMRAAPTVGTNGTFKFDSQTTVTLTGLTAINNTEICSQLRGTTGGSLNASGGIGYSLLTQANTSFLSFSAEL